MYKSVLLMNTSMNYFPGDQIMWTDATKYG